MGQAQSLSTEVEIEAPPTKVYDLFMNFERYNQWCSWKFEPVDTSKKPSELKAGDTLKVDLKGMAFSPVVVENTTDCFAWEGSLYGLLVGKHQYLFAPSKKNAGGTTVVQSEDFRGPIAFLFGPGWSFRQQTLDNWNGFFADLKKEAEKSS